MLGVQRDRAATLRVDRLSDAVTEVEGLGEQAQGMLMGAQVALGRLHEKLYPDADAIGSVKG